MLGWVGLDYGLWINDLRLKDVLVCLFVSIRTVESAVLILVDNIKDDSTL